MIFQYYDIEQWQNAEGDSSARDQLFLIKI